MRKMLSILLLLLVFCMLTSGPAFAVPISIDGDFSDWEGINPILTDRVDQSYLDLIAVYITNSEGSLYIMGEYSTPLNTASHFGIDIDRDPKTGLHISGIGMDYGLTIWENHTFIGDARDGSWSSGDFGGYLKNIQFSSNAFEIEIPLIILSQIYGETGNFYITGISDRTAIGYYEIQDTFAPVPEPATMFLLGIGLVALTGIRKKRNKI